MYFELGRRTSEWPLKIKCPSLLVSTAPADDEPGQVWVSTSVTGGKKVVVVTRFNFAPHFTSKIPKEASFPENK